MLFQENKFLFSDVSLEGLHIGIVTENRDPTAKERVKVWIIGIHDGEPSKENSIWAERIKFSKYESGDIPDIGDEVWVMFRNKNDFMSAVWLGWVVTNKGKE